MKIIEKKTDILRKAGYFNVNASAYNGGIRLTGTVKSYEDVLTCGRLVVDKKKFRGVINDLHYEGEKKSAMRISSIKDDKYDGRTPDALIIGGGIVGAAIARELTKYDISVMLLEKEYDIATGQSSRNDGMIHAGIDLKPSSKKVKYNMRGNKLYETLSKELDVPISKVGQYVLFMNPIQKLIFPFVKARGAINKIPCEYRTAGQIERKIPDVGFSYGGMFFANAGIVCPYLMTIALAENAVVNGAEICLNTVVTDIKNDGKRVTEVITNRGKIYPKVLINAAGIWSDKIAELAGDRFFTIHPRRGVELILDKKAGVITDSVIGRFVIKSSTGKGHTKGGGIVRTIDQNVLLGPSATETPERENEATTKEEFEEVYKKQSALSGKVSRSDVITYFAGTRAATYEEEFIVEKSPVIKNLVQAAGIQSPGITAAPAIAEDIGKFVSEIIGEERTVSKNEKFNPIRKGIPVVRELEPEERDALIKENPNYGIIVCRCDEISKGEIIDALKSPVSVPTLDAVKRRVRAGMGRCQGGFCSPLVTKIIAEETGLKLNEVRKKGEGSELLYGEIKESYGE